MKTIIVVLLAAIIPAFMASASEEESLRWISATIHCGKTAKAGTVSCEIKTGEKGWEQFAIQAFGKTHTLSAPDLAKLKGFPLSSLRTSHEAGWEQLGGYTVSFRFARTFYNPKKTLITETIYVSVTKNGITVADPRTKEH